MAVSQFEATARHRGQVAIIDLRGEIDRSADALLEAVYTEAGASNPSTILLNFADVDYINSTGIAVIVGLLARARKDRRSVTVCGLSQHYREIFEITRLADFMTIFEDEETAVADVPA